MRMPSLICHLPFQASVLVPSKRTLASEGAFTETAPELSTFRGWGRVVSCTVY